MKKIVIKFFLALSIFISFNSSSSAMEVKCTDRRKCTVGDFSFNAQILDITIPVSPKKIVREPKINFSSAYTRSLIEVVGLDRAINILLEKRFPGLMEKVTNAIVGGLVKQLSVNEYVDKNQLGFISRFTSTTFSQISYFLNDTEFKEGLGLDKVLRFLGTNYRFFVSEITSKCSNKIVHILLNKPDANGITPLRLAVNLGHWEMALELLSNRACGFVTDSSGMIIDCVLFDQYIPVLNKSIPVEFFGEFKECLIREIYSKTLTVKKLENLLRRKYFSSKGN